MSLQYFLHASFFTSHQSHYLDASLPFSPKSAVAVRSSSVAEREKGYLLTNLVEARSPSELSGWVDIFDLGHGEDLQNPQSGHLSAITGSSPPPSSGSFTFC
ncbi:hypothetical protein TWF970_002078 [Orbilia oligospora]|uniref:Uncharacterized protein n=1 Tax=Orbilia oligospora TaxID=2813651 RepID=A0A7C8RFQ3_ORBOL|nr:hypothetical protein TWF970_002078 [Orbilia oligospora]